MGPARKTGYDRQPAYRMFAMPERDDEKMFSSRLLDGTLSERSRQSISTIAGSRYLDTEGGRDYSLNQEILRKSKQKHWLKSEACTDCARDWHRIGSFSRKPRLGIQRQTVSRDPQVFFRVNPGAKHG